MSKPLPPTSSPDLIDITPKQQPVITLLHHCIQSARAHADAIRDNAQDDGIAIPPELVASFELDCNYIINSLREASR